MVAVVSLALLVASALAQEKGAPKAADAELKDARQKASYGIGLSIGKNLKNQGISIDLDPFSQGLRDALAGTPSRLSDQQIQEALQAFQKEVSAKQAEMVAKQAKEGETFLAENKKKAGVKSTASGLQYKVIKEGAGKTPKATDSVMVNYEGRLVDGTVFDSSAQHPNQEPFEVGKVIKGFSEALQLMKVGSKWEIYIPANLAYGATPPPGLPPNAPLIFNIELKGVQETPNPKGGLEIPK
jgi:FKBP-type peptidyl-prolyl cis-trans isomerase